MRQFGFLLAVSLLAACSGWRDAFSAHADVVASAAGESLTAEQLARMVADVKRVQPKAEQMTILASVYVDYMVFAAQLVKGRNLDDSLLVLRANWPVVSQLKWGHYHDQILAARGGLTPAAVDSAYAAGNVRLFQHILIQVPSTAAPKDVARKREQAEQVLQQVRGQRGAVFAAVARRVSDDPGSKTRGGYLPAGGRGRFVAPFETAAWALEPGGISGIVSSPFGFHVIRRPPLAEVRDSFAADLGRELMGHLDSIYVDSIAVAKHLTVDDKAPAIVRDIFSDLIRARTDDRVLATYTGGAFRGRDLSRWIDAIGAEQVRGLPGAGDAQIREFLRVVAQRDLLLAHVDSASGPLGPDDWKRVLMMHDSAIAILKSELGLTPQVLTDSAPNADARRHLAAAHVTAYLQHALQGTARFFPVPPFLAAELRQSEKWSINPAGVSEAVERVVALRGAGPAGAPEASPPAGAGGAVRPAPGPAPIPLDTTRHVYVR